MSGSRGGAPLFAALCISIAARPLASHALLLTAPGLSSPWTLRSASRQHHANTYSLDHPPSTVALALATKEEQRGRVHKAVEAIGLWLACQAIRLYKVGGLCAPSSTPLWQRYPL